MSINQIKQKSELEILESKFIQIQNKLTQSHNEQQKTNKELSVSKTQLTDLQEERRKNIEQITSLKGEVKAAEEKTRGDEKIIG